MLSFLFLSLCWPHITSFYDIIFGHPISTVFNILMCSSIFLFQWHGGCKGCCQCNEVSSMIIFVPSVPSSDNHHQSSPVLPECIWLFIIHCLIFLSLVVETHRPIERLCLTISVIIIICRRIENVRYIQALI